MAKGKIIQFRVKSESQEKASYICEQLGMDLPTYLRICISRLIKEDGLPFDMSLQTKRKDSISELLDQFGEDAKKNGTSEMTLEEINAEIDEVRQKRLQ